MDLLGQVGGMASLGSLILSRPARLMRGGSSYAIQALVRKTQKPYRANENRRPYDCAIRVDSPSAPVEPIQNDIVEIAGSEWLVWRILPSSAGSHWELQCMAPPTVGFVPVRFTNTPDGGGGTTQSWVWETGLRFFGKYREASMESRMTATDESLMGRLSVSYSAADAPVGFNSNWRVQIEGITYEILSVSVDDENPMWRNAVLAAERSS